MTKDATTDEQPPPPPSVSRTTTKGSETVRVLYRGPSAVFLAAGHEMHQHGGLPGEPTAIPKDLLERLRQQHPDHAFEEIGE